ncbi:metal ABC transporter permease [Chloroflexus sp. Y-396-1]|uniref:metal ABC transporter permease n=1 Tax=Chloroflexus sp. Y-396-1 TaxID=867845 RepID=UPI00048B943A|nr:metal ABC transporter permease [Chloroflexus sp. Y-396-1]
MSPQLEVQLIAVVVAAACTIPGVFLVLRRMAMLSDAISHTVLLGIVLAYLISNSLTSPLLFVGAVAMGVITVWLVELVSGSRLVHEDSAIGLVFPALFALAVLLISRFAGNVHLDTDSVLLGELAFAPFDRIVFFGLDLPRALVVGIGTLILNLTLLLLFYKELKLVTFDPALAATLGFTPTLIHYGLMTSVSLTAVTAFDAVGSVLVVALMIAPPATAYLLTDRLPRMIVLSVAIGIAAALSGYWLARLFDVSIAGTMATMTGVGFLGTFLFAPRRGIVAQVRQQQINRERFALQMLTLHLLNHEGTGNAGVECHPHHLIEELRWPASFATSVVRRAEQRGLVQRQGELLILTEQGRQFADAAIVA